MQDFSEIRNMWFVEQASKLDKQGISRADIARRMEVKPQYLTPFFNKNSNRRASEKFINKFCKEFNINHNDLLNKMKEVKFEQNEDVIIPESQNISESIPLIPVEAMAGYANGDVQVMKYEIKEHYIIPEFEDKGVKFLIRASGESMCPKYSNGDILACRPIKDLSFFQWGKVYVLDTDQGPLVKRLFSCNDDSDYLECHSENKKCYPPFRILKNSIRKVSIVVGVIRLE